MALDDLATEIRAGGGVANGATVDAFNKRQVDHFVESVVARAGHLDSFDNMAGLGDTQGPLMDISAEDAFVAIVD